MKCNQCPNKMIKDCNISVEFETYPFCHEFFEPTDVTLQRKTLIGIPYDANLFDWGSSHGH
ncbi:hypothetical protein [Bacillus sp. EAC]|uniref:hypothetical protein n=1 Tax=Bacillus sp. EAC TaxID=1978338 RepID=UPI000B4408A4|nr:hypothetical protein [Bacillus sp. EAC]